MNPLVEAVLRAGLLSPERLQEMKRFSPVLDREAETEDPKELVQAAALVETALSSAQMVLVRETDLEVLRVYAESVRPGTLRLVTADEILDVDVTYGRTALGEYIIAWRSESIKELLVNGATSLIEPCRRCPPGCTQLQCVFFKDVRELFFGDQKAFMVCVPSVVEHAAAA